MLCKTLLFLLAAAARAAPLSEEMAFYEKLVAGGDWNERVYAVNQLGQKGADGKPGIRAAVKDPDWQIRLNAVHWLGRLGGEDAAVFEGIARDEACRWVRMAALHWLGRSGGESPPQSARRVTEDAGACRTWSWSAQEKKAGKIGKRSKTIAHTPVDDKGCQYVQFQKKRGSVCPKNTILRGIGMPPYKTKLGLGRAPDSGVALCCPGDPRAGPLAAATGRPAQVECRLVPQECPRGWTLLEPAAARPWENRDFKYRRTHSHRQGDLNWVPCCRPHQTAPPAEEPDAPQEIAVRPGRDYLAEEEEFRREEEAAAQREEWGEDEISGPDERAIARRLLGRRAAAEAAPAPTARGPVESVPNTERVSEIDALIDAIDMELGTGGRLSGSKETLPPPETPTGREERRVAAEAGLLDIDEELPSVRLARMARELGEAEGRLAGPSGPGARREAQLRARLTIEEDHGSPAAEHDALPALLAGLRSKDARARARAAEQLGAMDKKGEPAVPLLLRALGDGNSGVRANAAIALGNLTRGQDEAVGGLKRLLDDKHPDVRYSAAQALGRIGTPESSRAFHKSMRSGMRVFLGSN